jgi:hypothetical protein
MGTLGWTLFRSSSNFTWVVFGVSTIVSSYARHPGKVLHYRAS